MRVSGRKRRHLRIRKRIKGTPERPRLCVFRSNKYIYGILADDLNNKVITQVSSLTKDLITNIEPEIENTKVELKGKMLNAYYVGYTLAQKAKALGITKVVFDRAGYKYHGRVKALAEGARKGGLIF
ncbi:MAG: 50S ribosomal protein L18 [candidate division WOR-3 bacterium]|nr:50S ribosomal protein L18 [candidate division WOR-3 bacterium]MCX7757710.1 50S ribosomal protein L18 [candidate division WOR-3 bacterium]MDW7988089.1 50S ribosomal protein L18 [candidate division WOR-3 bacterium]